MRYITVELTEDQHQTLLDLLMDEELYRFENKTPESAGYIIRLREKLAAAKTL